MALVPFTLKVVHNLVTSLKNETTREGQKLRVLSLGYPDILAGKTSIGEIFGTAVGDQIKIRTDSKAILGWHNLQSKIDAVPDSMHLFELLGCELEVVDIEAARGNEIILNLNDPCSDQYHERYDLILDAGTLEHCFNIAQAMKNIAQMVSVGGYIMQGNPLNWYNHGFYNLNPTFYHDFYGQNGFRIIWYEAVINATSEPQTYTLPPYDRFQGPPPNATNLVISQREKAEDIIWPIQTKYRNNPTLKKQS